MKKYNKVVLGLAALVLMAMSNPAQAETRFEKKVGHIGGPEVRVLCVSEWRTDFPKMSGCNGWATQILQHEYFFVATAPDVHEAVRAVLNNALENAMLAGAAVLIGAPLDPWSKLKAAEIAFWSVFSAEVALKPVLNSIKGQIQIGIQERSYW